MYCKNCGAEIADGSAFCTECGAPVQKEEPIQQEPIQQEPIQQEPVQPQYVQAEPQYTPVQPAADVNSTPILITGILALALCWTGIGGLICAIICMNKVKQFQAAGGVLAGKAKVGKILGTLGLVFSILYMVFWVIYFIVVIVAAIGGALNNASSVIDF